MRSELNILWDISGKTFPVARFGYNYLEDTALNDFDLRGWRQEGHDRFSIYADPEFADISKRDFSLAPNSPARALGFHPIDSSDAGCRKN